jgi:hypothetical protein
MKQNAESLPVGVVVERRKSDHPWLDHTWRAVAVIPVEGTGAWRGFRSLPRRNSAH